MDKLLPCPFCNTNAPMFELDREQGCKRGQVVCGCCGCKGPEVRTDYTEDGPWIADAIREWNTRHTPEGWQLVPVEPRKEQLDAFNAADKWLHSNDGAGYLAASSFDGAKGEPYYKAMLAAAPKWGGE